ncbi:MAG: hypothetical protein LC753_11080 [Acidobacteria bacterium]|nr:hypothetical protein [Acidobacteriota bacterium]MCA1650787.1 hypothetical protein [Acidobacteriota bacterium]
MAYTLEQQRDIWRGAAVSMLEQVLGITESIETTILPRLKTGSLSEAEIAAFEGEVAKGRAELKRQAEYLEKLDAETEG